jgi:hypothetical protein
MSRSKKDKPIYFVIISPPRSGSWLLWTSLAQHPSVAIFGELFNEDHFGTGNKLHVQCSTPAIICRSVRRDEPGDDYLHREILLKFAGSNFHAVGFKLLYDQARQNRNLRRLWLYLAEDPSIRIIHLWRANLLEGLISLKMAIASDQWICYPQDKMVRRDLRPLRLSHEECMAYYRHVLNRRRQIQCLFTRHRVLAIEYKKELVGSYNETMARIQMFLGLMPRQVRPVLEKQSTKPIQELVANYQELRETFTGPQFALYFESGRT